MLLENLQKAFTSEPGRMGICLNSLDSEPKPECIRNTSVTSYLQMMRHNNFHSGRTPDTLDLPSVWQITGHGQDIKEIPSLFIHNYKLEVIHEFVYLRSTMTENLSIDSELNKRIGKAHKTSMVQQQAFRSYQSQCI